MFKIAHNKSDFIYLICIFLIVPALFIITLASVEDMWSKHVRNFTCNYMYRILIFTNY